MLKYIYKLIHFFLIITINTSISIDITGIGREILAGKGGGTGAVQDLSYKKASAGSEGLHCLPQCGEPCEKNNFIMLF
jgi:hypothetical protein